MENSDYFEAKTRYWEWLLAQPEVSADLFKRIQEADPNIINYPDAPLTKAAPALLEACKAVLGYGPDHIIQQIRQTIRQAEGEE